MNRLLVVLLPLAAWIAAKWVARQEALALARGQPLDPLELEDARAVGVQDPERIRVCLVECIAGPSHPLLEWLSDQLGLFGHGIGGITYGYGIFLRRDAYPNRNLVAHECVHTAQYERLGGLSPFLAAYFRECLLLGYPNGPLEREAIRRADRLTEG